MAAQNVDRKQKKAVVIFGASERASEHLHWSYFSFGVKKRRFSRWIRMNYISFFLCTLPRMNRKKQKKIKYLPYEICTNWLQGKNVDIFTLPRLFLILSVPSPNQPAKTNFESLLIFPLANLGVSCSLSFLFLSGQFDWKSSLLLPFAFSPLHVVITRQRERESNFMGVVFLASHLNQLSRAILCGSSPYSVTWKKLHPTNTPYFDAGE